MKPKLLSTLPDYTPRLFLGDLFAGISVALVAIPLSIALLLILRKSRKAQSNEPESESQTCFQTIHNVPPSFWSTNQ